MNRSDLVKLLDDAAKGCGARNDSQLAKAAGVQPGTISRWRSGDIQEPRYSQGKRLEELAGGE